MRFKIFIYTIVLVSTIACTKDDLRVSAGEDDYIRFSAPSVKFESSPTTRAKVEVTSLPDNAKFGVWGYCKAFNPGTTTLNDASGSSEWSIKKSLCPPTVFSSSEYENMLLVGPDPVTPGDYTYKDNTNNGLLTWDHYSSLYSFLAIYPAEKLGSDLTLTFDTQSGRKVNSPVITYTMPISDDKNSEVSDFNDKISDVMVGWVANHQKADGHVKFELAHMMSSLSVRVNNYSMHIDEKGDTTGTELKIHSIKLFGTFYKTLTVDMKNSGAYDFSDKYTTTYVLYDEGSTEGEIVPWKDDVNTTEDETTKVVGTPLMLLCGKPGDVMNHPPYGPNSLGHNEENDTNGYKIILKIDYTFGTTKHAELELLNPNLAFIPRVGVNYTFQLNWIGEGDVLLVIPTTDPQWGDGIPDDDIIFE